MSLSLTPYIFFSAIAINFSANFFRHIEYSYPHISDLSAYHTAQRTVFKSYVIKLPPSDFSALKNLR